MLRDFHGKNAQHKFDCLVYKYEMKKNYTIHQFVFRVLYLLINVYESSKVQLTRELTFYHLRTANDDM